MNLLDHRLATVRQIRAALAIRMFELHQLRRCIQTTPTKPEAAKASAIKIAPLGRSNRGFADLRQADLGCQLRRSLVQIWTLVLTNCDTNLGLN
jgi:hypothetical protein